MALVNVSSGELNRRAESRSQVFLHSSESERTMSRSIHFADQAMDMNHKGDQMTDMSRSAHFYAASEAHMHATGDAARASSIPARGISAENITPKTPLKRKQYGSDN